MLHQFLAPYRMTADFGLRLQREMLGQWLDGWSALMTAAVLAPLAVGDPVRYAALAATLALLVGLYALLAGVLRIGFIGDLLSRPVLIGYMAGVAVIMITSQLGKVTGVDVAGVVPVGDVHVVVR